MSDDHRLDPEDKHDSDLGNARRLVALYGKELRYVPAWKTWLCWTGKYWKRDETGEVMRCAKKMVATIYSEAGYEENGARRITLSRHAVQSESERSLHAAVNLAGTEPGIPVTPADLDSHPFKLNVGNGTLDLRTATLFPHDPADLITKWIPTSYDPKATAPTWDAFLNRIFGGRQSLIGFVQRAIGYAATSDMREQVYFILLGVGANGKSTFVLTLMDLLQGYAGTMNVETVLSRRQDMAGMNDLLDVAHARFVSVVEPDLGRRLAEGLVKTITGGDAISVKKLYKDVFKIRPGFKIFLSSNHRPVIRGSDLAIWRRIRLIPFDVVIPDDEQDRTLGDKLRAEAAGILRWVVDGCRAWQGEGLRPPTEVRDATARYRADMDDLGDFFLERCVIEAGASVSVPDLYGAYVSWCKDSGEEQRSQKALGLELGARGFQPHRTKHARFWLGIRLTMAADWVTHPEMVTDGDALSYNPSSRARREEIMESASSSVTNPDASPEPWEESDMFDPPELPDAPQQP